MEKRKIMDMLRIMERKLGPHAYSDTLHTTKGPFRRASWFGDGSSSSNLNDISLSQWQELTQQDLHSMLADPAFVDLSATGLKLGNDSPCFDAGKDQGMLLGNDAEAAINIGAYISDDQSEIFGVRNAQN